MDVDCGGSVSGDTSYDDRQIDSEIVTLNPYGLRPIVCLKPGVKLVKQSDSTYNIE